MGEDVMKKGENRITLKKCWNKILNMVGHFDDIGSVEDIGQFGKGFNTRHEFTIGDYKFKVVLINEWHIRHSVLDNCNKGKALLEFKSDDVYILIAKVGEDEYQVSIEHDKHNSDTLYLEEEDLVYFGEGISDDIEKEVPNIKKGLVDRLDLVNPTENWSTKKPKGKK
jgi:hypothetical protein